MNFIWYSDPFMAEFIGKWRGRPVVPGEQVDLKKILGASCTLVLSHQQNMAGRTYVSIDAVSKAAAKVTPSGTYDSAAMRQRIAEWQARETGNAEGGGPRTGQGAVGTSNIQHSTPNIQLGKSGERAAPAPKSGAATAAVATPREDFDPEVGF